MNKNKVIVLLCSLSFITTSIGYGTWINEFKYEYSENNKVQDRPVAYIIGREDVKYTSIEKALDVAQSGDIVSIIPAENQNYNSTLGSEIPDKVYYEISKDCVIKPGVTLVIPTDKNSFSSVKDQHSLDEFVKTMGNDDRKRGGDYSANARNDEKHYLRATIKINSGVTLINQGKIILSGYLSGGNNNSGIVGQTTHSYTQIILGTNSKIVQNDENAEFRCYGFIHEEKNNNGSLLDFSRGLLYLPLIIYDYRGFSFSYALMIDAMSKYHSSPFNDFGVENIEPFTIIGNKVSVYGVSNLYISYSNPNVEQNFYNEILLVSTQSSSFINFTDTNFSSMNFKIDKVSKKIDLGLLGGVKLNNIAINLNAGISISLDTKDSFLPISYRYNIKFKCSNGQTNASFDCTKQRVKFLPGSTCIIENNTNVKFSDLIVYSAFSDGSRYSLKNAPIGRGNIYPVKEGASFIVKNQGGITCNALGGVIYTDNSTTVSYSTNIVSSYEPWNIKSSGQLLKPWTIDEYLVINEKLQFISEDFLKKQKIFVALNIFNSKKDIIPEINLHINNSASITNISNYQRVIFVDELIDCKIELLNNIYKVFNGANLYEKDTILTEINNRVITVVNSLIPISSNNNGINEFDPQSINISCETPLIDNKVPLYPDANILLKATVNDIDKIYNPIIKWTSSNEEIATIDNNGKVLGKKLGKVTFSANCNGISDKFETEVINKGEIIPITQITINDNKGNSAVLDTTESNSLDFKFSKKYSNNQSIPISLKLNEGARWSSIEWNFSASAAGRQYINDNSVQTETIKNVEELIIHTVNGTGASDDTFTLTCKVTDFSSNVYVIKLTLIHKADACLIEGTLIAMADGTYKKIENVHRGDYVKVFNHLTGNIDNAIIATNIHEESQKQNEMNIINLIFNNGIKIRICFEHGFFDYDLNKYIYINENNFKEFVGRKFVSFNEKGDKKLLTLIKAYISVENVKYFSPVSYKHLNIISNGLLSMGGGLSGYTNYFELDENMIINKELMYKDIEKYGLFAYEEWKNVVTMEEFEAFNIRYLKVSLGKHILNINQIYRH